MANYIETYTGKKIDFDNPDPDQFDIEDIMSGLQWLPRFAGQTSRFYSVLNHSYNVSRLVPDKLKYEAFMHDATEAYLGDMPTPFKRMLPDYRAVEQRFRTAICLKFGLPFELHEDIHEADKIALMTERDKLKLVNGYWGDEYERIIRAPAHMFAWEPINKKSGIRMYNDLLQLRNG